ncbi:unnamed protein product [Choristocarpus tenellus]
MGSGSRPSLVLATSSPLGVDGLHGVGDGNIGSNSHVSEGYSDGGSSYRDSGNSYGSGRYGGDGKGDGGDFRRNGGRHQGRNISSVHVDGNGGDEGVKNSGLGPVLSEMQRGGDESSSSHHLAYLHPYERDGDSHAGGSNKGDGEDSKAYLYSHRQFMRRGEEADTNGVKSSCDEATETGCGASSGRMGDLGDWVSNDRDGESIGVGVGEVEGEVGVGMDEGVADREEVVGGDLNKRRMAGGGAGEGNGGVPTHNGTLGLRSELDVSMNSITVVNSGEDGEVYPCWNKREEEQKVNIIGDLGQGDGEHKVAREDIMKVGGGEEEEEGFAQKDGVERPHLKRSRGSCGDGDDGDHGNRGGSGDGAIEQMVAKRWKGVGLGMHPALDALAQGASQVMASSKQQVSVVNHLQQLHHGSVLSPPVPSILEPSFCV